MSSKYTGKVNVSKFDKKEKQYSNNADILIGTHLFRIIPKPWQGLGYPLKYIPPWVDIREASELKTCHVSSDR